MTMYYKNLLNNLSSSESDSKKNHYLFLLGTAVNYVDRPVNTEADHFYIRGETFSYAAQLTSHLLGEDQLVQKNLDATNTASENYAHAYHSPSVDVINGADTPGFEAGDRIAKALMLALDAVAAGKERLHISGFSRGGVESIVLTHELDRVKRMLVEDLQKSPENRRSLSKIIADSSSVPGLSIRNDPSYTRKALMSLVDEQDLNIPNNKDIDSESNIKEKLLNNLIQLKVDLFVLDPVPGGNFGKIARIGWQEEAHFYTLPDFVENKQEFVQQHETSNCFKPIVPIGMPYEVIPGCHGTADGNQFDDNSQPIPSEKGEVSGAQDMILRRWIDFTFPDTKPNSVIDLGHPSLDDVVNGYMQASIPERNSILLANYQQIMENFPAFEFLASRNYKGLGRYMALRQVHFHQRGNTPITDLDVHGGGKFLNLQHVQLWMSQRLTAFNFFDKPLSEQVEWIQKNIQNAFTVSLLQSTDPNSFPTDDDLMIAKLMNNENNHALLQESLSFLVNTVTQTYLRNHLSFKERETCRRCMEETFKVLEHAKIPDNSNANVAKLAESMYNIIRTDLTQTMVSHQNSLLSLAQKLLQEKLSILSETNDMGETPIGWLLNVQKTVNDIRLLKQQIEGLQLWCDQEMLNEAWGKILPNFDMNGPENISFIKRKERFLSYISQQESLLKASASDVLKQIPDALEEKPAELDHDFYQSILPVASIEKQNLVIHQLQESNQRIDQQNRDYHSEIQTLRRQLEEAAQENKQLTEQIENQGSDLSRKGKDVERVSQDLQRLTQDHQKVEQKLKALQSDEQREAVPKVLFLINLSKAYLKHLETSKDTSELLNNKKHSVRELLAILKDNDFLPTEQISRFNDKLNNCEEQLKEHRDPSWQRFFRDCLRIIAITVSGIGFYRIANGKPPHFFKPSHGEAFVDDAVNQITTEAII